MSTMGIAGFQSVAETGREQAEATRAPGAATAPALPAAGREAVSGNERRHTLLTRTIEAEIIPRLVLSGRAAALASKGQVAIPAMANHVIEFSRLVVLKDEDAAVAYVERHHAAGINVSTLLLDLMAPAARVLGAMWEDDTLSFAEVTIGLGRLQRVLHRLSVHFQTEAPAADPDHRILLVPAPGEQHTFGLSMLGEFFRHAQWEAVIERPASRQDLCRLVRSEWFAVIGFSVALTESIDILAAEIRAVRRASRNRSVGVMVGGPAFLLHPERVALVGADATAIDGQQAVVQAQHLLALLPPRH